MQKSEQELGFIEIFGILWSRRWWLAIGVILGAAAGVVVALTATPEYRSEVLVQPVKKTGSGAALQALSSQLGGIASLAGLELGGQDDTAVAVATLTSHRLTSAYITEKNLLPVLYYKLWDAKNGRWNTTDPEKIPTVWAAERMFSKSIRTVTESRSTGLVTMTIDWKDPVVAAQWAHDLVIRADNLLRVEAHDNAQRNIEFLEKQLQATNIVEVRQTLNRLLEEQWNKLMLAQGDSEYAFRTIDPAEVPKHDNNLSKKLVVLIWVVVGLVLSSVAAVVDRVVRSRRAMSLDGNVTAKSPKS